jgi:hypothetical protein
LTGVQKVLRHQGLRAGFTLNHAPVRWDHVAPCNLLFKLFNQLIRRDLERVEAQLLTRL